jgi:hypothetical protein
MGVVVTAVLIIVGAFALFATPAAIVRVLYGPVHDPEHIAALKLSRRTEGERLPDGSANDARVGAGNGVVTHHAAATTSTRG